MSVALRALAFAVLLALPAAPASAANPFELNFYLFGPRYDAPPTMDTPVAFKEGQGEWVRATPSDALERGPWWQLFNDPVLNDLAGRVEVSNQNVAAAVAAYALARALTAQQRAALFPAVSLDAGANRSGTRGGGSVGTTTAGGTTVISSGGGVQ